MYLVFCLGGLVSFTWCLYEYEYMMSWLRMIKSLSIECIIHMWPWMMLRGPFMWNLEPSGKVMELEVESHNGILLVINNGIKFNWMEGHDINP